MYVKDYMQAIIMTISPQDHLSTAHRIMIDLFIRHLPVVLDGNQLVGILTDRDIRQASPSSSPSMPDHKCHDALNVMTVNDVMTQQVYTVTPDTTLLKAATILLENMFDCLPVVDEHGLLQGLITTSDFMRVYIEQHENVIL